VLALALLWACDDPPPEGPSPRPAPRCAEVVASIGADGIAIADEGADVRLAPAVRIGGEWRHGDGDCAVEGDSLRCPVEPDGVLWADLSGCAITVRFSPAREVEVEGLSLVGSARVDEATGWISNGYQSWSQSGVVALGEAASDEALAEALAARGDVEVTRTGEAFSNWYTLIGGAGPALFAGALSADRFRPWVQVSRAEGDERIALRLASGGAGERVAATPGADVIGETFLVDVGDDAAALLAAYGAALPSRRTDVAAEPEVGWNSWYELWAAVDEEAVRANADLALAALSDMAAAEGRRVRIVVDDGWEQSWGEWTPNERFPSGMDVLAADLHALGLDTGIWLAPLLAEAGGEVVAEHPDWFLPAAQYAHTLMGAMAVLDVTNPEAARHLADVIATIVGWGYDLLKIDFLFAGAFEDSRAEDVTGTEAYHRALELIRSAAGEATVLLAVGAPPVPSFPHVDSWRLGGDIAFEPFGPSWYFVVNQARSLGVRWFLCAATLCDPDPPLLRDLTTDEVGFGAWVVALAGGGVFLSDDLRELPAERLDLLFDDTRLGATMAGEASIPIDQFPTAPPATLTSPVFDLITERNGHVFPTRWRAPGGVEVTFNPSEDAIEVDGTEIPPHGVHAAAE
jgi:hypothetical protein